MLPWTYASVSVSAFSADWVVVGVVISVCGRTSTRVYWSRLISTSSPSAFWIRRRSSHSLSSLACANHEPVFFLAEGYDFAGDACCPDLVALRDLLGDCNFLSVFELICCLSHIVLWW